MKVYLNKITGIDDAIVSMYMSKRTWTRELEEKVRSAAKICLSDSGKLRERENMPESVHEIYEFFVGELAKVIKWGARHMTMLRFIDFSFTVEGMHRAGQDDWDSHSMRFNNRIIRSSTRLASYGGNEISSYYQGKIIPMDEALSVQGIKMPEEIEVNGEGYVRATNGYIKKELANNRDVKRGLYMLSIPSNYIFKVQATEFAHVYKERNASGTANPEVKEACESMCDQIEAWIPSMTRELWNKIPN